MDFSERLKLWKGQILTFRNDRDVATKEYEKIVINSEEKDLNKLQKSIEKKRKSLMEIIGISINEINEFAPLTGKLLEGELLNVKKLENEVNTILGEKKGFVWFIKNRKILDETISKLNQKMSELENLSLGITTGIDETVLKIDDVYSEYK